MSSVTSSLRQIPTGLQYYAVPNPAPTYYVPVNTSNPTVINDPTVTNYPLSLTNLNITLPQGSTPILRDMGKTVKATVSGNISYYRQYQLIVPQAATTPISPNDGVIGSDVIPSTAAPYYTVYLPVTIIGMGTYTTGLTPLAGGQM